MRIAWFSPLLPARTDIAHFTARVLPALAARADVTLWTDQPRWDSNLERYAAVRHYRADSMDWAELNAADATFFNFGNDARHHASILQVARRHAGVPILHDVYMHELFAVLYRWTEGDRDAYLQLMQRAYGAHGRRDGLHFWYDRLSMNHMVQYYSMAAAALDGAVGAVVHTSEALEVVRREGVCPVASLPLAFPAAAAPDPTCRSLDPPYRLVAFGYIHHNRRLEALFAAIAGLEWAERRLLRLDIFGELWDRTLIEGMIASHGLDEIVTIHGFVSESELDAALDSAHLAVNLRYPSMGEASGSQLRIWDHSLPSLVTETGMYARLPADAVAFVRPEFEVPDIQRHLRALLVNPIRFVRMGETGRRVLEERHSPELYAQGLVEFVSNLQRRGARPVAYRLGERTAVEVAGWMNRLAAEDIVRRVAAELHTLTAALVPPGHTWGGGSSGGSHSPGGGRATIRWERPRAVLPTGATIVLAVRVQNTGDDTWPAQAGEPDHAPVRLGNHWLDPAGIRVVHDDGRADLPRDLRPGEDTVLYLTVRTPEQSGSYLLELDMLREGVAWFAESGSETLRVAVDLRPHDVYAAPREWEDPDARPSRHSDAMLPEEAMRAEIGVVEAPPLLWPGSRGLVRARVRNRAGIGWPARGREDGSFQINLGNRWMNDQGEVIIENDARAPLPHDVDPDEQVLIPIAVKAPQQPGHYRLLLDVVQENVSWFGLVGSAVGECEVLVVSDVE